MDSPFVGLVRERARDVYGVEPLLAPNMAGSGPMYLFSHGLGLPIASAWRTTARAFSTWRPSWTLSGRTSTRAQPGRAMVE